MSRVAQFIALLIVVLQLLFADAAYLRSCPNRDLEKQLGLPISPEVVGEDGMTCSEAEAMSGISVTNKKADEGKKSSLSFFGGAISDLSFFGGAIPEKAASHHKST